MTQPRGFLPDYIRVGSKLGFRAGGGGGRARVVVIVVVGGMGVRRVVLSLLVGVGAGGADGVSGKDGGGARGAINGSRIMVQATAKPT